MSLWQRRLPPAVVVAVALATTLAACGTTVPQDHESAYTGIAVGDPDSGQGVVGPGEAAGPADVATGETIPGAIASNPVTGTGTGVPADPVVAAGSSAAPESGPTAGTKRSGATASGISGTTKPGQRPSATTSTSRAAATGAAGSTVAYPVGVTATTITVGIAYQKNIDELNSAAGGGAITSGDLQADAKIVIDDINAHGGLGGRPTRADLLRL